MGDERADRHDAAAGGRAETGRGRRDQLEEGFRHDPLGARQRRQIELAEGATLGEAGIKTLDDFADLSSDELIAREDGVLREFGLSAEDANTLIMAARAHWFDDEAPAEADADADADAADGTEAATGGDDPAGAA